MNVQPPALSCENAGVMLFCVIPMYRCALLRIVQTHVRGLVEHLPFYRAADSIFRTAVEIAAEPCERDLFIILYRDQS